MSIRIAVAGAAGRMGRRIIALAADQPDLSLVAALESAGSPHLKLDSGQLAGVRPNQVPVSAEAESEFDVLIDFTRADATARWLDVCLRRQRPIVIGTTGHDDATRDQIRGAGRTIPVLHAPNMSVGVNVLLRAVRELAAVLDASYDVEIVEAHHRFKVDAPSGTAIALRDAVMAGRAGPADGPAARRTDRPNSTVIYGRHGLSGTRPAGEIALHSLRLGDTIGEHAVHFGALGETVTVAHSAHSRDTFVAGALRAARWIVGKSPGVYSMQDVLFGGNA